MTGCYLSIDFEDFSHDLQRVLGVKKPKTRRDALVLSIRRIMKIVKTSPGSDRLTFFTTGQVARDHGEIIKELSDNGHEIGCHSYYHDNVHQSGRQRFASSLADPCQTHTNRTNWTDNGRPSFTRSSAESKRQTGVTPNSRGSIEMCGRVWKYS